VIEHLYIYYLISLFIKELICFYIAIRYKNESSVNYSVQETDGSFFESFTALSWKQENRRLVVLQEVEVRAKEPPPPSRDSSLTSQPYRLSKKEVLLHHAIFICFLYSTIFVCFIVKVLSNFSNSFSYQFQQTIIFCCFIIL